MAKPQETWRDFIARIAPSHTMTDGAWTGIVQGAFGFDLHTELKELLRATNGIKDESGCDLIWPIERMVDENRRIHCDHSLRKQYMPLDCLFFFSDAGTGDLFGYSIVDNQILYPDVFVWMHENDSRYTVATSLRAFIEGWVDGTIGI